MSSIVGLIPARAGSKGLPGKNLKALAGKPLLAWTIDAALGSRVLDAVLVSTDDPAIASAAQQFGAEVPFLRPPALAQDDTPALDVALHALDWLEQNGRLPECLLWLQPTSPLRSAQDIVLSVALLNDTGAPAVLGVCETKAHPWQVLKIGANGTLEAYLPHALGGARRQDLPPAYQINGALYLIRVAALRSQRTFLPPCTRPYVMPAERSVDIDNAWDFFLAETSMRKQTL
jgi:CMP-N-acetylneuraminic acid synthetase